MIIQETTNSLYSMYIVSHIIYEMIDTLSHQKSTIWAIWLLYMWVYYLRYQIISEILNEIPHMYSIDSGKPVPFKITAGFSSVKAVSKPALSKLDRNRCRLLLNY